MEIHVSAVKIIFIAEYHGKTSLCDEASKALCLPSTKPAEQDVQPVTLLDMWRSQLARMRT